MTVRVEHQGPVTTVILDRSERKNAVDRETAAQLADAFRDFAAREDARVAVLWGDGGTFCAGADLKAIAEGRPNRTEGSGDGPMGPTRMQLDKPVIAAIEGYAVAGGLELALWCDLRVAAEDAVLGVFCRRFGVPLIDGGTVRLPRLIGLSQAMDLILTGRPVSAEEGVRMGLINRMVPAGAARIAAETLAAQIAKFPQACMRADRRSAYQSLSLEFEAAMDNEIRGGQSVLRSESLQGARAFVRGVGLHGRFDPE